MAVPEERIAVAEEQIRVLGRDLGQAFGRIIELEKDRDAVAVVTHQIGELTRDVRSLHEFVEGWEKRLPELATHAARETLRLSLEKSREARHKLWTVRCGYAVTGATILALLSQLIQRLG